MIKSDESILKKIKELDNTLRSLGVLILVNNVISVAKVYNDNYLVYYENLDYFKSYKEIFKFSRHFEDDNIIFLEEIDFDKIRKEIYNYIKENYIEYFV